MAKRAQNYFWNLLKAMRIYRVLAVLLIILIPAAYSNKFPLSLLSLSFAAVFIYSASSIYNAYRDNDYKLPRYFFIIIVILFLLAFLLSFTNKIILFSVLIAILLGFVYNTIARIIPMGDAFIAGLTHHVLPFIASSLLVRLNIIFMIKFVFLFYFLALCIGPVTNLKDIEKDKKKRYRTVVNSIKNPELFSMVFLDLSFIIIFVIYVFFKLDTYHLLFLIPIFLFKTFIFKQIYSHSYRKALYLMRLYLMLSFVFLIFSLTNNFYIILSALIILLIYILTLLFGGYTNGNL